MVSNAISESDLPCNCNLECLTNEAPVHEFVGPVKVVLVDVPKNAKARRKCMAGLIAIANMMIGATVMTVLYFTLTMKLTMAMNLHIVLCTLGYQLCVPSAVLLFSKANGVSSLMTVPERKRQHLCLQIVGLICVSAGSVLAFLPQNWEILIVLTPHSLCGVAAFILSGFASLNGPGAYFSKNNSKFGKYSRGTHVFFGILTLLVSSICFSLGLFFSKSYNEWTPIIEMVYIPIILCSLYTIIVICSPLLKTCDIRL